MPKNSGRNNQNAARTFTSPEVAAAGAAAAIAILQCFGSCPRSVSRESTSQLPAHHHQQSSPNKATLPQPPTQPPPIVELLGLSHLRQRFETSLHFPTPTSWCSATTSIGENVHSREAQGMCSVAGATAWSVQDAVIMLFAVHLRGKGACWSFGPSLTRFPLHCASRNFIDRPQRYSWKCTQTTQSTRSRGS